METTYLNWAATSAQKPKAVIDAATRFLKENHDLNLHRALPGVSDGFQILVVREAVNDFFGGPASANVIFTPNVTTSLNMILHGLLEHGRKTVLTTPLEHNSVLRPLALLEDAGKITVRYLPMDETGELRLKEAKEMLTADVDVLVMNHASNVLGTIQPIGELFALAKAQGTLTVLDAAQTAGFLPIDMKKQSIDYLAFTGHKSLLGLAGSGGFVLGAGMEKYLAPWLAGGTGSASELLTMPDFLPDKYEPGTPNTLGILSLGAGIQALQEMDYLHVAEHERRLTQQFLTGLADLPLRVLGPGANHPEELVPVVSVVPEHADPAELGQALFEKYGIITRSGLHCAPLAHRLAGTLATGALRFSFGYATTEEEIALTLKAIHELLPN